MSSGVSARLDCGRSTPAARVDTRLLRHFPHVQVQTPTSLHHQQQLPHYHHHRSPQPAYQRFGAPTLPSSPYTHRVTSPSPLADSPERCSSLTPATRSFAPAARPNVATVPGVTHIVETPRDHPRIPRPSTIYQPLYKGAFQSNQPAQQSTLTWRPIGPTVTPHSTPSHIPYSRQPQIVYYNYPQQIQLQQQQPKFRQPPFQPQQLQQQQSFHQQFHFHQPQHAVVQHHQHQFTIPSPFAAAAGQRTAPEPASPGRMGNALRSNQGGSTVVEALCPRSPFRRSAAQQPATPRSSTPRSTTTTPRIQPIGDGDRPSNIPQPPVSARKGMPSIPETTSPRTPQPLQPSSAVSTEIATPPAVAGSVARHVDASQHQLEHHTPQKWTSMAGQTQVRFSWIVARALVKLMIQPADTFRLNGQPWKSWQKQRVPTLGASPTSCRVQEMYKVTIPAAKPGGKSRRLFAKAVPVSVWRRQWESQNKWQGEFVTDGENFVMEAAALAFLEQYGPDLAPKLLGVLEISGSIESEQDFGGPEVPDVTPGEVTHVVILSELYGEDLLDFLESRDRKGAPLTADEKRVLQLDCLMLLRRLHAVGLSHLDFTPENVLIGDDGLRVCDFAKATPLHSNRFRHITIIPSAVEPESRTRGNDGCVLYAFESCEPTVGKGAYMPPECWSVYWRLEETRMQYPLEELWSLSDPDERRLYYFSVAAADIYMVGVLLFWLWSEGGIWKCSDVQQDNKYAHLVKNGLNFDLFRECRTWPATLKSLLRAALHWQPSERATLDDLLSHPWFQGCVPSSTRWRWSKMASRQRHTTPSTTFPTTIVAG